MASKERQVQLKTAKYILKLVLSPSGACDRRLLLTQTLRVRSRYIMLCRDSRLTAVCIKHVTANRDRLLQKTTEWAKNDTYFVSEFFFAF